MARVLPYPWSLIAPRGAGVSLSLEDCETADPLKDARRDGRFDTLRQPPEFKNLVAQ